MVIKFFDMERVTVFIDGFNFYYGLKRMKTVDSDWKKFYWLDMVELFNHFMRDTQVLQKVYYFTTPPINIQKKQKQSMLLNANLLRNRYKFEYIKGKFIEKQLTCPICQSIYTVPEEKRTDVNISVYMMGDCAKNKSDTLILVTADSDLLPTIKYINRNHPDKKVRVFFPPLGFSNDINNYIKGNKGKVVRLEHNKGKFLNSIMPDTVTIDGKTCSIPPHMESITIWNGASGAIANL